ncbi:hypothetical protein GCM10010168_71230 [Actinoplanes ianthinogenes]|uniref:Secreted protein n=1 Tax=Actinoplanes ianthinogenes TaxID=122358 RepID=A0ABM7M6T2_9ACTN|nr:hypothetical protein [Actinoplanes ianthinogenes]BCJ47288.1 hypothetical protein Aiant_79450 [Actinoplanes ianthinogenes]GGR42231.1 hypothetical protein GCM10010168_71230 [Actinoplanes ianthinogenes]
MRKRIAVVLATAAFVGATAFASPSQAANEYGCSTRAEGSTGASAICTKLPGGSQAVQVSCRRAANGRAYTNTGNYAKKNKRSYAYCASGDIRTGYRTNAYDIILA